MPHVGGVGELHFMVVWHRAVTQASPTLRVKVFVDDRTCWALSDGAVGSLCRAAAAGSEVDDLFNLTVHPDKRASFGSSASARRKLAPFARELGPVQESFKLLGVRYSTKRGSNAPDVAALNELVTVRCERVSKACRNLRRRALLLRSVVVSALARAAGWQRYSAKTLQGWQSCIERAHWSGQIPKQRSKLLARAVLGGPYLELQFAGDLVVLRSEWRRRPAFCVARQRWFLRVLRGTSFVPWGWVEALDLSVHTLLGIYDPKWHSVEALMRAARHAWHLDLWNQDGRAVDAGPVGCVRLSCRSTPTSLKDRTDWPLGLLPLLRLMGVRLVTWGCLLRALAARMLHALTTCCFSAR